MVGCRLKKMFHKQEKGGDFNTCPLFLLFKAKSFILQGNINHQASNAYYNYQPQIPNAHIIEMPQRYAETHLSQFC